MHKSFFQEKSITLGSCNILLRFIVSWNFLFKSNSQKLKSFLGVTRTENFYSWPRSWLQRFTVEKKFWKKCKLIFERFHEKKQQLSKIKARVIWYHLTSNDVIWRQMIPDDASSDVNWRHLTSDDVSSRHEDNLTGSAVCQNWFQVLKRGALLSKYYRFDYEMNLFLMSCNKITTSLFYNFQYCLY